MAQAVLNLHSGGHELSRQELALIEAPPPTETWHPIRHSDVLDAAWNQLVAAGFAIKESKLAISHEGDRFFGTLDLESHICDGVGLAVGIRNSCDKTFPIGFACGQRVFTCSNLAFTSEVVVSKRHTRFGKDRYLEGLSTAVASLGQYQATAAKWIDRLRCRSLTKEEADSLILRSYEEELIGARLLPLLIKEWRSPSHDDFAERNAWSLWNAFTAVLKDKQASQPSAAAVTTIKLQRLLSPEVIDGEARLAT